jgi:hypothetical protein
MLSNGDQPTSEMSASALGCSAQATNTASCSDQFLRDVSRRKARGLLSSSPRIRSVPSRFHRILVVELPAATVRIGHSAVPSTFANGKLAEVIPLRKRWDDPSE